MKESMGINALSKKLWKSAVALPILQRRRNVAVAAGAASMILTAVGIWSLTPSQSKPPTIGEITDAVHEELKKQGAIELKNATDQIEKMAAELAKAQDDGRLLKGQNDDLKTGLEEAKADQNRALVVKEALLTKVITDSAMLCSGGNGYSITPASVTPGAPYDPIGSSERQAKVREIIGSFIDQNPDSVKVSAICFVFDGEALAWDKTPITMENVDTKPIVRYDAIRRIAMIDVSDPDKCLTQPPEGNICKDDRGNYGTWTDVVGDWRLAANLDDVRTKFKGYTGIYDFVFNDDSAPKGRSLGNDLVSLRLIRSSHTP
jgi:hypothetical protein